MTIEAIGYRTDKIGERFTSFYDEHHPDPQSYDAYTLNKWREVASGKPTWVVTSFTPLELEQYDLAIGGRRFGSVLVDTDGNAAVMRHVGDGAKDSLLGTFVSDSGQQNLVDAIDLLHKEAGIEPN